MPKIATMIAMPMPPNASALASLSPPRDVVITARPLHLVSCVVICFVSSLML